MVGNAHQKCKYLQTYGKGLNLNNNNRNAN